MTDTGQRIDFLAPGTPVNPSNCEGEPIHVPGNVQPRTVLLAASDPDHVVQQVSVNLVAVRLRLQDCPGQALT